MKARDSKGRFSKKKDDSELILAFPSPKTIINWIIILFIFFPWLVILSKFNLLERVLSLFDSLFKKADEPTTDRKKMDYFIKEVFK